MDVGDGWKTKIEDALKLIEKVDSNKYKFILENCNRIDYWNGHFSTTEDESTILIPTSELRIGVLNDIAAIIVHESLHLYYRRRNFNISQTEEEKHCYFFELDFLYRVPNVEPWLIRHAKHQIFKYSVD